MPTDNNPLKQALLLLVAHRADRGTVHRATRGFSEIDADHDGALALADLVAALEAAGVEAEDAADDGRAACVVTVPVAVR